MAERKTAEVNWAEYYARIRSVCPWSYRAFLQDRILVVEYSEEAVNNMVSHTDYDAVVVTCVNKTSDWLEQTSDRLNEQQPQSEWLWSHPEHGGDSTPIPVLIQQDRKTLTELRDRIGYSYDE